MSLNKMREQVAEAFIASLNEGDLPWEAGWRSMRPENAITGKSYRGINSLWLSFQADRKGYSDPRWCTFKQAKDKGWHVKKDEKSTLVEFWSLYDKKTKKTIDDKEAARIVKDDPDRKDDIILMSRAYCVFNGDQIEGIPELPLKNEIDIETIRANRDTLLKNMAVGFCEQGSEAYYTPSADRITMPPEELFNDTYSYMATFLHESGHATGASHRMNRDLSGFFGSEAYTKEELRAEIASAFTAQALGFGNVEGIDSSAMRNHKAYVQSWIKNIESDPKELFAAIKDAEKISDYLIEKGEFLKEITYEQRKKPSLEDQIKSASVKSVISQPQSRESELVH